MLARGMLTFRVRDMVGVRVRIRVRVTVTVWG